MHRARGRQGKHQGEENKSAIVQMQKEMKVARKYKKIKQVLINENEELIVVLNEHQDENNTFA